VPLRYWCREEIIVDFADRIRELAGRVGKQLPQIQTEEATKTAIIMPFIAALGYDVFNPGEVTPELNADIGIKKGEKVDYAILIDGNPAILWECKHHKADLGKEHASQLYRYFSVTTARFGVLTNGLNYWFYTDLDASNKMDARPFFEFNLLDARDQDIEELKKFTKSGFNVNGIINTAGELKFTREIKRVLVDQLQEPGEEFVKFFATATGIGRLNQTARGQFTQAMKRAFRQFINEQVNERLKSALNTADGGGGDVVTAANTTSPQVVTQPSTANDTLVSTTDEEREAFMVIRAILRDVVDIKRIVMRDVESYCGILLDDNNRRPICRLYFNAAQHRIGLFDNPERKEAKVNIDSLDDIYQYADRLRATMDFYKK
jgi:predicted type IV restriction endonuclease